MPLIINGQEIDDSIIEQEFANIKASYESAPGAGCMCDRDEEFREMARDNIVARVLLTQEAERLAVPVSAAEIEAEFDRLKEQHGGEDAMYFALGTTAEHADELKEQIVLHLRVQKLLSDIYADVADPDDEQVQLYYEQNPDRYMTAEQVRASHILKQTPQVEHREATYQQLREIREQLLAGADFEQLARQFSDAVKDEDDEADEAEDVEQASAADEEPDDEDDARSDGIDLGYFARGEIMEEFEIVAFSLRTGEISPVFMSPYGLHLMKVTDRQDPQLIPLDEVIDDVRDDLLNERRNEVLSEHVAELEAEAVIELIEDEGEDDDEDESEWEWGQQDDDETKQD